MKKTFQAPAQISKITTMADNTLRLQIDCQEMQPDDESVLLGSRNKYGHFLFQESEPFTDDLELPDLPALPKEKDQKTKSQTFRAVLYLLWKQKGKKDLYDRECDSETYYNQVMEHIIGAYKEKLD